MQSQDHVSETLGPILILRYGPHVQPKPSQERVRRHSQVEVDDGNQSELFCVSPMGSKAGMSLPIPHPHHMVSLHQSA